MEQRCKLEYKFWITVLTIAANSLKVFCFVVTYRIVRAYTEAEKSFGSKERHSYKLLITKDDALASFLEVPEKETIGMNVVEKVDFQNGIWVFRWVRIDPMPWRQRDRCASFRVIGLRGWIVGSLLLAAITLVPGISLLAKLSWLRDDIGLNRAAVSQLGIGNPSALFLFGASIGGDQLTKWHVLRNVALANTPQLAVSIAYYIWNNHLTAMIAANEYKTCAAPIKDKTENISPSNKRSLRVTEPQE